MIAVLFQLTHSLTLTHTHTRTHRCLRYNPVSDACWAHDEDVPYRALAITLSQIEAVGGRLDKVSILRSFLQSVVVLTPRDLANCIMMCSNTLAPAFMGVELGVGDAILMKVVSETTGRDLKKLREALRSEDDGDLGLIAERSRGSQKKLSFFSSKPKAPQTVATIFGKLTEVAGIQGSSSGDKKSRLIKSMLADATPVETRFIVRACSGKLRVGMAAGTVMPAVAHAIAYNDPLQAYPPAVTGKRPKESSDAFKDRLERTVNSIKQAFCELPDWNKLTEVLTTYPLCELADRVYISPGTPVAPMLAKPSTGVADILKRCNGAKFACEWKYDGERAQVHMSTDGTVRAALPFVRTHTRRFCGIM
jgi:DNA ligase-1